MPVMLPGGLYWEGRNGLEDNGDNRTDVELEFGPGQPDIPNNRPSYTLRFVTGSGEFNLTGILPADLDRLGKFLSEVAQQPT